MGKQCKCLANSSGSTALPKNLQNFSSFKVLSITIYCSVFYAHFHTQFHLNEFPLLLQPPLLIYHFGNRTDYISNLICCWTTWRRLELSDSTFLLPVVPHPPLPLRGPMGICHLISPHLDLTNHSKDCAQTRHILHGCAPSVWTELNLDNKFHSLFHFSLIFSDAALSKAAQHLLVAAAPHSYLRQVCIPIQYII